MKTLLTILVCFTTLSTYSQEPPPPAAMADSSNHELILEVAEASRYDLVYAYYKDSVVSHYAEKYNWSENLVREVKGQMIFKPPPKWDILNAFANHSRTELRWLKELYLSSSDSKLIKLKLQPRSRTREIALKDILSPIDGQCKKTLQEQAK
jgi:hypothetical protein